MTARSTSCAQEALLKGDGDALDTEKTEGVALRVASVDADDEGLAEKETLLPGGLLREGDTETLTDSASDGNCVGDGDCGEHGGGAHMSMARTRLLRESVVKSRPVAVKAKLPIPHI